MRIKITLQTKRGTPIFVPYEYNHIIQGIIYSALDDKNYGKKLHDGIGFKYFTYSRLYLGDYKHVKNSGGFICRNGRISFILASPSEKFVNNIIAGLSISKHIRFQDSILQVSTINIFNDPEWKEDMNYEAISPVLVRKPYMKDGKLRAWDLNPSDPEFFSRLEENTIKKYNQFVGHKKYCSDDIDLSSDMRHVKGVRVGVRGDNTVIYNKCYLLDLRVSAPVELQRFVYNAGIGEKTSMGFGCIE